MDKMKTVKIAPKVHTELKIFIAQNEGEDMSSFAGYAIMKELKERGHKFVLTPKKKSKLT
jgi:hypothetical protein